MVQLKELLDIKTELLDFQQSKIIQLKADIEALHTTVLISGSEGKSKARTVQHNLPPSCTDLVRAEMPHLLLWEGDILLLIL